MIKILIAEDESSIANLITNVLKEAGYEMHWAADGKKAADILEKDYFDLVLLDIDRKSTRLNSSH